MNFRNSLNSLKLLDGFIKEAAEFRIIFNAGCSNDSGGFTLGEMCWHTARTLFSVSVWFNNEAKQQTYSNPHSHVVFFNF